MPEGHPVREGPHLAPKKSHQHAGWDPLRPDCLLCPPGVARILTHEAGITDIAVLQVTFPSSAHRQAAGAGTGAPFSSGAAGLSGSLSPGRPAP